jgi:hypothetical protein
MILAFGVMIWYIWINKFTLYFAGAFNFFWGLQDSGLNNFIYCVLGFQFKSKTLPFSIYFFAQSFFCFVFTCVGSVITHPKGYLIYVAVSASFGLFAWLLFLFTFDMKPEPEKVNPDEEDSVVESRLLSPKEL